MKLPSTNQKRIRRFRQTIYEDPGNPFNIASHHCDEEDEEMDEREEDDDEEEFRIDDAPPAGFWGPGDLSPAFPSGGSRHISTRHEFDSILGSDTYQSHEVLDARDEPPQAPTPERIGTPEVIKVHSFPSIQVALKREDSGSTLRGSDMRQREGLGQDPGNRDTAFYAFYDDVLKEYSSTKA